jgi:hypothetical protein
VEGGEEKVTRAVAGEEAPRPVGPVCRGGEAEDDYVCVRVAEAGDRKPPVVLVRVGSPLLAGYLLAPGHKPRTAPAGDHRALERSEFLVD